MLRGTENPFPDLSSWDALVSFVISVHVDDISESVSVLFRGIPLLGIVSQIINGNEASRSLKTEGVVIADWLEKTVIVVVLIGEKLINFSSNTTSFEKIL